MPNFKEFIKGFEEKPEAEQPMQEQPKPKEHEITEAKLPESRFLKNDPYYKLVEEKKPKAYREHLFYPEGDKIALHGTSGERLGEFASEDEIKEFVDKKYEKPKKTVGEDLQEMYEKEFFKQANGNKEDFVNHFINRFGVPKGSSKKREAEFYGKRFDELSANQEQPKPQPKEGTFQQAFGEETKEEYKPAKNYNIYGEVLSGNARKHMQDLAQAFNDAGLEVEVDDTWRDYGAGAEWTTLVNGDTQILNPKDWVDYMNGEISAQELVDEKKNDRFLGKRFKNEAKQPKQGSFEQAFGNNQPREEFSQEDKAALVATYGAFPEEGIVARKLPNGNYLTNILSGADTEPEEVDEATLSKVFDELRGEKGFEEIINEWRENPNLIRERRNVQ